VCSPDAAKSRWVQEEILRFRALHGGSRILTVLARGTLSGADQDCFPPALYCPGQGPEPIAADLRPGGDGRRVTTLKLVAGMLGVGLDELIRRDRQRRHRYLIVITGASIVGMLIMGGLAMEALIARNDAQAQRAHAEGLIEFMLTDLRKKLEPSGQLELMDGVGREALRYYGAQSPANLDAQSLSRQARALRLMGEIRVKRGDLNEALISFQQASAATAEILARSPGDGRSIFNHAQNVFWVGEIAHQRGDRAAAESSFDTYLSLAEKLTAIDPKNDDWRAEVAYAQSALGTLFLEEGHATDAVLAFTRALAIDAELAAAHPDDSNLQYVLGQGHAWLADALRKEGRLAGTSAHRRTELAIYQTILQKDPTIRDAKFSSIVALESLGELAMISGDVQGALSSYRDAASRAEALLVNERDNMDLHASVAIAQVDFAEALLNTNEVELADKAQRRASELLKIALSHDSTVTLWQEYNVEASQLQAAIAYSERDYARALQLDRLVLDALDVKVATQSNTQPFWLLLRSRLQTGDDLAALGRVEEAKTQWNAVVEGLAGPIEIFEPKLLVILRAAKLRLSDFTAAALIAQRLNGMFGVGTAGSSGSLR
ncbi:MAG: hypothetical protein WA324_08375, partial [Bryobacteraceae bacterium]